MASTRTDLPAPVSPVRMFKPGSNSTSSSIDHRQSADAQKAKHVEDRNSHDIRPLTALRPRVTLSQSALFPAAHHHVKWRACCACLDRWSWLFRIRPVSLIRDGPQDRHHLARRQRGPGGAARPRRCSCSFPRSRGASSSSRQQQLQTRDEADGEVSRRLSQEQPLLRGAGGLRESDGAVRSSGCFSPATRS